MDQPDDLAKAKARCWVMTLFANEKYPTMALREGQLLKYPDWVKYFRYGLEVCPETQNEHFQCWVECWNPVRFSQFRAWIGDSFREPMYGRIVDNEKYCSKDGIYKDVGDKPMQGRRTDIIGTKRRLDNIADGESIEDIASEEPHFSNISRMHRFAYAYVQNKRRKMMKGDHTAPEVHFIYGPPGCGKTRYVRELEPDLYVVPASDGWKWKDGYNNQPAVLYDNITNREIKANSCFLQEIDRYPIQCPVKGGFVAWKPKRIYITSTDTPMEAARGYKEHEFIRRLTNVVDMRPPADEAIYI